MSIFWKPNENFMTTAQVALIISTLSILIAALSLGWNIYRDVVLKPRMRVQFGVFWIGSPALPTTLNKLVITATNFGPGIVYCRMLQLQNAPLWRRLFRKAKYAGMLHDYTNRMSGQLPAKLDVGENIQLLLDYNKDCFLKETFTHVGLSDSFGRIHWCPRKDVKTACRTYRKDFGISSKATFSPTAHQ